HCQNGAIAGPDMTVSAQCNRVNVSDGHMASIRVKLKTAVSIDDIRGALASFTSQPQQLKLHSAPEKPIVVRDEIDRPQPRLDRDSGNGMSITVGRVMAHAIFVDEVKKRALPIEVYSAGVLDFSDQPQLEETAMTCLRNNTSPPPESPTWVRQLPLDAIGRFLVMEQFHADALTRDY